MEKIIQEQLKKVIAKIKEHRLQKGYSMEYMAEMLKMSVSGYNKIENNFNNISLVRLLEIQTILGVSLEELLGIKNSTVYQQHLKDNAIGYQQQVENLYQENKEVLNRLVNAYQEEISFLRKQLDIRKSK